MINICIAEAAKLRYHSTVEIGSSSLSFEIITILLSGRDQGNKSYKYLSLPNENIYGLYANIFVSYRFFTKENESHSCSYKMFSITHK